MLRFYKKVYISFINDSILGVTHKTDFCYSGATFVLAWFLKQVKGLILEFFKSWSFFSEKTTYWLIYYNIVLFLL